MLITKNCDLCGGVFQTRGSTVKYCSRSCSNKAVPRGNAKKRFFDTFYQRHAEKLRTNFRENYHNDPEFRYKVLARVKGHRHGKVPIQPCERCGNPDAEKHHDDYSRPHDYRWLCRSCHAAWHVAERRGATKRDIGDIFRFK